MSEGLAFKTSVAIVSTLLLLASFVDSASRRSGFDSARKRRRGRCEADADGEETCAEKEHCEDESRERIAIRQCLY